MNTIERARRLEIRARRLVQNSLAGGHRSPFRGAGMAFDEVRPYLPGDDVRRIDWHVTARTGEPYVKRYQEERELTLLLLVDVSGSTDFGSVARRKRDQAAEIAALLAAAALQHQDKAGLLLFTDRIESVVRPARGRKHTLRLVHHLLAARPQGRGTDLALALAAAGRLMRQPGILCIVSDFMVEAESFRWPLRQLGRRHDLMALVLQDPLETAIEPVGLLAVADAESGDRLWLDTGDPAWQAAFTAQVAAFGETRAEVLREAGADMLVLPLAVDVLPALARFLQQRSGRPGR